MKKWTCQIFAFALNVIVAEHAMSTQDKIEITGCKEKSIQRMNPVKGLPSAIDMRDWHKVSNEYIDYLFDSDKKGKFLPLLVWKDKERGIFSLPAYIGSDAESESITYFSALLTGTLVGKDMCSYKGRNWLALEDNFYSPESGIFLDRPREESGQSFWYDVIPNVLFDEIDSFYPEEQARERRMTGIAKQWEKACIALGASESPWRTPDFDHAGFNFRTMRATDNITRIEPEGAAGIAWLEYMSWTRTHDPEYLTASKWCLESLLAHPSEDNPLYEVLLPYAPVTAARMNVEAGTKYNVGRLLNWCFSPSAKEARPGWGVITGKWGKDEVDGLVGSTTDGGGYAFAMNTFSYIGTLAPLARYDSRYAQDLGKWLLHAANAARLFYSCAEDSTNQSSFNWSNKYDPDSVFAYEGLRNCKRGSATATAEFSSGAGAETSGNYISTKFYQDNPPDVEILRETPIHDTMQLDHVWKIPLPTCQERVLVVSAERVDRGHALNSFRFSYSNFQTGPFQTAFTFTDAGKVQNKIARIPQDLTGTLYLKVESADKTPQPGGADEIAIDTISISYPSKIAPYAQGDVLVSWLDLIDNSTTPVVLYRPASSATDFGLYGSSFVGLLGGIQSSTDVAGILQWDLLKTDYFHAPAYPTFLYYNPYADEKCITVDLGVHAIDVYDSVKKAFISLNVTGKEKIKIGANCACVLVLVPHGTTKVRAMGKLSANGVVIDYGI